MRKLFRKKAEPRARLPASGDRSRPAFSYYAGEKQLRQGDSLRARQANEQHQSFLKKLRLVPTLIALGVILLSVVYSTTLSTNPIVKFVGEMSPYQSRQSYEKGIETILGSSLWNHSKLTLDTAPTEAAITKQFPEFDLATVSIPIIGRRPTVTVHAREPALVLTTKTNSYVLDTTGKIVSQSNQLASGLLANLPTVQDQSGVKLAIGDQALTSATINFINNIRAQLAAKQLTISGLTLPPGGYEIDVHIKDISYYLKTESSGDARLQIGAFLAAKDSGLAPSTYMDVRVEEKVFYK